MNSGFENGRRVSTSVSAQNMCPHQLTQLREDEAAPGEELEFRKHEEELIEREVQRRLFQAQAEAVRKLCFLLIDAKKPKRRIYQLLYACGMGAACGGSASSIAKEFGVSRQAFEQEGERDLASLDIRKNPLEKAAAAGETYSGTNYRRQSNGE